MNNNKKLITLLIIILLIGLSIYFGVTGQYQSSVESNLASDVESAYTVIGEQKRTSNQSTLENHQPVSREECFTLFDKNQTPDSLRQQKIIISLFFFGNSSPKIIIFYNWM